MQRLPDELIDGPDETLDLGMLWRALRRSWIGIVGLCIVVSLIAALMAMRQAPPGAVATISYQPWMARLVAVQEPEFFTDPRAIALFREQCQESGAHWNEPPPPAPERTSAG